MNEDYFYIIDHKNSFSSMTKDHQTKLQLKLLISCTSIDSSTIGNEINKFFTKIIPYNNYDLMTILYYLSKSLAKDKRFIEREAVYDSISWIISSDFCKEGVFAFSVDNIDIIGTLLVKLFLNELPLYKIKAYAKFTEHINTFINSKKDMITAFNAFRKLPIDHKANKPKANSFQLFKEKTIRSKVIDIPIELAFLLEKFNGIRKIIIPLEALDDYLFNLVLIILLNFNNFFRNCESIDFDLSNTKLSSELMKRYHRELTSTATIHIKHFNMTNNDEYANKGRWTFATNHIENLEQCYSSIRKNKLNSMDSTSDSSSIATNLGTEEKNKNLLNEYQRLFEMCIIYPYFISQWKKINSFQLIFPNAFSKEVVDLMKSTYNVVLMNYSLFDFFQPITQLKTFTAEFNSLDSETFEKLMSLIISNNKLQTLTLSLFVFDLYYQPSALFKLMNRLKINIKSILKQNIISKTNSIDNDDVDQLFINHLMMNFEENLEELFWILRDQSTIRELNLFLVTPTLISNHETYMIILIKFTFNFLLLLNLTQTEYWTFKLIVPYLLLDNRMFPGIHELFSHLDYEANNHFLETLSLQMQFYSITNISSLLTTRLTEVNLGDLDLESFEAFISHLTKKEFTEKSKLRSINIALLGRVTQFNLIKESMMKYVCLDIKSLETIMLSSFLYLNLDDMNRVYNTINYNPIRRYEFIFGKSCESINKMVPLLYYYNTTTNTNSNTIPKDKVTAIHIKVFKAMSDRVKTHSSQSLFGRLISFSTPIMPKQLLVSYK